MDRQRSRSDALGWTDYLRILRRHWWVALLAIVVIPAAAYYFSERQTRLYTASAQVLIANQGLPADLVGPQNAANRDPARWADTQARIAQVPEVAQRTLDRVGSAGFLTPNGLLQESSVSADPNSDIMTFRVTDKNPKLATALVNEYALQFIAYRRELDTTVVRNALGGVANRIAALRASIGGVAHPDQTTRQQLGVLLSKQQDLQNLKALQGGNLLMVESAHSATVTQPLTKRNVLAGLLAGVIAGLGGVMAMNSRDRRVRTAEDAAAILGIPLLGRLPAPNRRLQRTGSLVMRVDPDGQGAEPFRRLRVNVDLENARVGATVILITSAVEKEGKSTTVSNLGLAFARAGRRVSLVDFDLRRPMIASFFGLRDRDGVEEVIRGRQDIETGMCRVFPQMAADRPLAPDVLGHGYTNGHVSQDALGSLDVLPAGAGAESPAELVASAGAGSLLRALADRSDIVLVDSPPALPVSDALTLLASCDGVVVVTRNGATTEPALLELRRLLEVSPVPVMGVVFAGSPESDGYYYSYRGSGPRRAKAPDGAALAQGVSKSPPER